MGGNASSPKPYNPNFYAGGPEYLAATDRNESVAVFTSEKFDLSGPAGEEIKKRFGGLGWLTNQGIKSGHTVPVKQNGRYVYYVLVKKTSYSKTLLKDFQSALAELYTHAIAQNVPKVVFDNYIPQGLQQSEFQSEISNAMGEIPWDFYNQ